MPLLSIIIPVYNKERYIDDCIRSVLQQSFTDFELILINDGSTDGSGNRCEAFKHTDSRIIFINQANAGVSAARNTGLSLAKGKYIGFIDSDDTIEPDMYHLLIKNALDYDADISVCRLRVMFPDKVVSPTESTKIKLLEHEDALRACLKGDLDRSANNKIYKAQIAGQSNFEGRVYEDILYTCKLFIAAQKTVVQDAVKYNYIVRDNSVSMSSFNSNYIETTKVSAQIVGLISNSNVSCLPYAQAFDVVTNISLLNLLLLAGKEKYKETYKQVVNTLLKYQQFVSSTTLLSKKHRYAFKAFFISPKIYTWLMYLYGVITRAELIKRTQKV